MLIVGIICMVLLFIICIVLCLTDNELIKVIGSVGSPVIASIGITLLIAYMEDVPDYKQGQIDALEGNVKYEKVYSYKDISLPPIDSTWVLIKE